MKKILAIDDQQDNLISVQAMLKMKIPGCSVYNALSGHEGIALAIQEQPDTILLDIKMPGMDGYEVCQRLKNNVTTKHIPVIMLTAIKTDSDGRAKAFDLGADAFLSKPIDPIELAAQVNAMLRIKYAEDELRSEKRLLKEMVKDRTRELEEKNIKLLNEIEKREIISQNLAESEQKYKALYENSPIAYQSIASDGSFLDVNPAWLNILGYNRDEVIGNNFFDFLHPESIDKAEKEIYPAFKKSGFIRNVDFKIRHKKGHYLDISYNGCAGYYPDGSFKLSYCVFQDITEKKIVQETLKQEQEFIQKLLDSLPGIFYLYTYPEMKLVRWNKNHETRLGYSFDELNNMLVSNWVIQDSKKEVELAMNEIIEKGSLTTELFLYTKTRKRIPYILSSIKFETKDQQYVMGVGIDISLQRKAEKAQKEGERKHQTLINNLQGIAYRCKNDKNWTMEFVSTGFEELTGYKCNDVVNNNKISFYELIVPEDRERVWNTVQDAVAKKEKFEYSYQLKTASGHIRTMLERGIGIYSETTGQLLSLEGFITDVTEIREYAKELAINNQRIEALLYILQNNFRSISELLDYTLAQAIELTQSKIGYIYFYNEETRQFTLNTWSGAVMKECTVVDAKTIYDLDATGCWGEAVRQRKPYIINNYSAPSKFKKGTPRGHVKLEKFLTVPVLVDDQIKAVIGVANKDENYNEKDIKQLTLLMDVVWKAVEKEKYQAELVLARQKAEESDQLKTAFLANMSHEIRTPMNAVLGFSELLLKNNIDSDEKRIFSEYIRSNGESLIKIIDDIIDISKIQLKQLTIKKVNFNLHIVFLELENYCRKFLLQKTKNLVELKVDIPGNIETPFFITSDDIRLKQILNNLIANAIKYAGNCQVTLGYSIENNKLRFFVKDNGKGLPKENQSHIFERFVQYSDEYISRQEGTGLGLSISKELVSLLGGELKMNSQEGKGSEFYFDIPFIESVSPVSETDKINNTSQNIDLSNFKILIVDDEESNYILTERILEDTKIVIEWASDGKKAIEMVENGDYNFIIMDIRMPHMDGIEATRLIRKNNKNIPIIIQTAFAMSDVKEEALKAGCDALIVKPVSVDSFMDLVNKYIVK